MAHIRPFSLLPYGILVVAMKIQTEEICAALPNTEFPESYLNRDFQVRLAYTREDRVGIEASPTV